MYKYIYIYTCVDNIEQIYDLLKKSNVLLSKFMLCKVHTREINGTYLGHTYIYMWNI